MNMNSNLWNDLEELFLEHKFRKIRLIYQIYFTILCDPPLYVSLLLILQVCVYT